VSGTRAPEPVAATQRLASAARLTGRSAVLGVTLVVVTWYAWNFGSASLQLNMTTFFVGVVMAVGLQVFSGNTGIISFGHMTFVGIAAYLGGVMMMPPEIRGTQGLQVPGGLFGHTAVPLLPALLITIAVVSVVALIIAGPLLRLPGTSAVIAIFALLLIAGVVFDGWQSLTNGSAGVYGVPGGATLWFGCALAVVAVIVGRCFRDSSAGLELQASREDELAAAASGVRMRRLRIAAWVLSAAITATAGVLYARELTAFSPTSFSLLPTFTVVVMVVVGGILTVSGAVLGAALVTVISQGLLGAEASSLTLGPIHLQRLTGLSDLVLVLLILGAMYLRPEGLMGRKELDEHLGALLRRLRRSRPGETALPPASVDEPEDQGPATQAGSGASGPRSLGLSRRSGPEQ
jgi:branched-chain amino acid transport system permease protein